MIELRRSSSSAISRTSDRPTNAAIRWICVRSPLSTRLFTVVPPGCATAQYTRPTGFSGEPPVGPAIPVIASASSTSHARRTPSAIAAATSELTAPCARSVSSSTPTSRAFALFAYVIAPPTKYSLAGTAVSR